MTKEEFVIACVRSGYATKAVAQCYAEGKEDLTDKDFIEVYLLSGKDSYRGCDGKFR